MMALRQKGLPEPLEGVLYKEQVWNSWRLSYPLIEC